MNVDSTVTDAVSSASNDVPRLAPFNPTADDAILSALSLALLHDGDIVVDLGCGDGRVLLAAAEACIGVRCTGFEFDDTIAARATAKLLRATEEGGARAAAAARVTVIHGDACGAEAAIALDTATVVFVYLVPAGLARVKLSLEKVLSRGGRVVSNMFSIPGWQASETKTARGCKVYLYIKE
jgi:precorrin-6B methylase 2